MVPYATRNALWTLAAPLAVLLLGIQLGPDQRERLLPVLFGIGIFSALLGILQLIGDPGGGLFFYRITNYGSAVGLFANRNHHAIFLATLPPMLLAWAALRSSRTQAPAVPWAPWAGAAGGILLVVPLILVAGSRSGLLSLVLGLLAVPAILVSWSATAGQARPMTRRIAWLRPAALLLLLLAVMAVTALTLALGRGLALERLIGSDETDMRLRVLGPVLGMIRLYLPWGSGLGTFTEIYELHEPHRLLAPFYMNHAHSDWLELVMTGGVPALLVAAAAIVVFLARLVQLLRPGVSRGTDDRDRVLIARTGLLILLMLGLASVGDYPLRTPSLACLAMIAALWAAPAKRHAASAGDTARANPDKKRP
jgi:O-antigen ligase